MSTENRNRRRGAAVLLEVLKSEGARYVFGNPGTTELPLIDALVDAPDIRYILALQEASAVAMADGYAQAACRPGVLNLHTTGGLGHGLGNLLNAHVSGTPLVVTAGQQDSRHTLTDPLLYGDLVSIATPAVKWAQEVTHPDQIPILVRRAFHDCQTAPTGPVFLSLPMDVMEEMTAVDIGEVSTIDRAAVAGSLDHLAEYLAAIPPGKLAIIAGDEISTSNAAAETVLLADTLGAPVYGSSWPAHIPFPTAHPLWMGNLPTKATEIAQKLQAYDAVFALGGKCLDHMIVFGEAHLRRILGRYAANESRIHRSLDKDAPSHRAIERFGAITSQAVPGGLGSPILQKLIFGTHRDTSNPAPDHIHFKAMQSVNQRRQAGG